MVTCSRNGTTRRGPCQVFDAAGKVDVTFERLEVTGGVDEAIRPGPGNVIRYNDLHHNDGNGIGCGEAHCPNTLTNPLIVENNEIHHNGIDPAIWHAPGFGGTSGGLKSVADWVILRGNHVYENTNGLWADVDGNYWVIEDNFVHDNLKTGIHYEISAGPAVIRNNTVLRNVSLEVEGNNGAGIMVVSSKNVEIYGNTIAGSGGGRGIWVKDDSRPYSPLFNIRVHHNTVNGDEIFSCRADWDVVCTNNS